MADPSNGNNGAKSKAQWYKIPLHHKIWQTEVKKTRLES